MKREVTLFCWTGDLNQMNDSSTTFLPHEMFSLAEGNLLKNSGHDSKLLEGIVTKQRQYTMEEMDWFIKKEGGVEFCDPNCLNCII